MIFKSLKWYDLLEEKFIMMLLLKVFYKKHGTLTDNLPIRIYINIIENKFIFIIKTEYHLPLLTSEMMKLLESLKNITKDINSEMYPIKKLLKYY